MKFLFSGIVCDDADEVIYEWFGIPCVSPAAIRRAVQEAAGEGELFMEVNSSGGNAVAGVEISNILRQAAADGLKVTAVVQSMAASAASYAILAASHVQMAPGSQMMLHRPWTYAEGNAEDLEQTRQMLESMFESMLDIYALRCGEKCTREELRSICEGETWLTAGRCVELGLADGIYEPQAAPCRNMAAAAGGLPDIVTLRKRYEEAMAVKETPAAPRAVGAALAIEQERFRFGGVRFGHNS